MCSKAKKTSNRLTVLFVNSSKLAPGLYGDGNNLFLSVRPSGSRSWVFRYRERGGDRIREMGLGTAGPDGVSLQAARDRAVALRADLRAGRDPIADKKAAAAAAPEALKKTFGDYALNDWLPVYATGFKNLRSAKELKRVLEINAAPLFPLALDAIGKSELLAVLTPIWATKAKTARELRARLETILQAATPEHRQGENPARWRGNLDSVFGKETKAKRKLRIRNHPAVVVNLRAIPESKEANARLAASPPEERNRKRFNFTGTLSDLAELLINKNKSGHAIFFAVNETDGQGRKKANFIAGRALVLDLDGTPLPDRWMVEPHWVIETSPGRFQCFFVIERTTDIDAVEDASRRLAAFYGGDPNVCDISHIFRLAGFFHQKRDRFRVRPVLENDFNPPSKLSDFDFLQALPAPESAPVNSGVGNLDDGKAEILFAELDAIAFGSNAKWLKLAMGVHAASGGDPDVGDRLFDWSATDPRYGDDGAQILNRARWNSFRLDKSSLIGVGTLVKLCHEHGVQESTLRKVFNAAAADFEGEKVDTEEDGASSGKNEVTPIERRGIKVNNNSKAEDTYSNAFIAVLQSGLDPAWEEVSQTVVFRNAPWNASHGFTFNDHTHRIVRLFLSNTYQGNAYEPGEKHVFDAIMAVAYQSKFNPVIDYLAGLTWDGVPRLDRLFVDYMRCGDSPYTRAVSACFGIGAVRRMRQPGCKLDTMPVVKGPQGWGKSTGVQALFGRQWFSDADMGSLKDKDAAMKLRGVWGVEFAEIDSLTKAATGDLKAFLSRARDRQRDPYGRIVEDHPRRCVFIGTVNEGGYLKDSTGARRFWPLELGDRVDVARIEADRDQLWAEAATREEAGESHVLPQALWSVAAEEQARQTTDDPWVDVLRGFLAARAREWDAGEFEHFDDPTDQPRPPDRVFTSELFDALHIVAEHRTKGQSQRLRTVMDSALGWKHRDNLHWRGEQGKGYTHTLQGHGDTY